MIFLRPLDVARVRMLHALGPVSRVLVVSREKRVAAGALVAVAFALALALRVPALVVAIGPLVLGVPHVVADLRYLVVRSGMLRERRLLAAVALPLLAAGLGGGLRAGTVAIAATLVMTPGARWRKALGLALVAPLAWIVWRTPDAADVAFAHLHNAVALLLWWALRREARAGLRWIPLAAIAAGAMLVLSRPVTADLDGLTSSLAPGVASSWAERLVVLYAFGQSMHYAVWLRLVPDEDRERATPRSFAASWKALRNDLGAAAIASVVIALFFAGWAIHDARAARIGYLRSATFHGHLELVALAYALVRGRLRA